MNYFGLMNHDETWQRGSLGPLVTIPLIAQLELTSRSTQGHAKVKDIKEKLVLKKGYLAEIGHY